MTKASPRRITKDSATHTTGQLIILQDDLAIDQRISIANTTLDQPWCTAGEVCYTYRLTFFHTINVKHIDVSLHAFSEGAAVVKTEYFRLLSSEQMHGFFDRELTNVTMPVGQQEAGPADI